MDGITNKTRLAEKRYRDKLKKDKKEIRLNNKKHKKQNTVEVPIICKKLLNTMDKTVIYQLLECVL